MARRAANPAALLRTYLAFNLVEDAAQLSLKELNAWSKRSAVDRTAHAACWFPMHLILEARDRCAKDNTLKSLHTTLTAAIDAYEARAKSDSDMLLRAAA
jgi:nuclear pore complex protein Nup160